MLGQRTVCASAAMVAASGLLAVADTSAAPRSKTIASYCSPSGDVCFGIVNKGGAVYLQVTTAARYFSRYTLCVRRIRPSGGGAEGLQRCGSFRVFRRSGSVWSSSVNYARNFPVVTSGTYRVTWKLGTRTLGPSLRFRLPLSG